MKHNMGGVERRFHMDGHMFPGMETGINSKILLGLCSCHDDASDENRIKDLLLNDSCGLSQPVHNGSSDISLILNPLHIYHTGIPLI